MSAYLSMKYQQQYTWKKFFTNLEGKFETYFARFALNEKGFIFFKEGAKQYYVLLVLPVPKRFLLCDRLGTCTSFFH